MGEEEGRLMVVEERLKSIGVDVADVKASMKDIASSLSTLAVLEVRHNTTADALARAFRAIDANTTKIENIEKDRSSKVWGVLMILIGSVISGIIGIFLGKR